MTFFHTCYETLQLSLRVIEAPLPAPSGLSFAQDSTSPQPFRLAELFATRTREEWCSLLEGTDACFAPVLSFAEAVEHPHIRDRNIYQERDGVLHVAPAPRFSRTPGAIQTGEGEPFDWE